MEPNCKAKKVDMAWAFVKTTRRHIGKKVTEEDKPLLKAKEWAEINADQANRLDLEKVKFQTLVKNPKKQRWQFHRSASKRTRKDGTKKNY